MLRFDFHGIIYDGFAFIRRNKFKFLIAFILAAAGCVLGIIKAFYSVDLSFPGIRRYNIMQLICGERGFFVYFLFRFLMSLLIIFLIALSGIRLFTAWLPFVFIFIYAYLSAHFLGAVFIILKLSVLPLALLCVIPFFLITLFIFVFFSAHIFCCSAECRLQRFGEFLFFFDTVKFPFLFAAVVCLIAALIESALACLLTIGIVL